MNAKERAAIVAAANCIEDWANSMADSEMDNEGHIDSVSALQWIRQRARIANALNKMLGRRPFKMIDKPDRMRR